MNNSLSLADAANVHMGVEPSIGESENFQWPHLPQLPSISNNTPFRHGNFGAPPLATSGQMSDKIISPTLMPSEKLT